MGNELLERHHETAWPLLTELMEQKRLGFVDMAISEHFLGKRTTENQSLAAFFCLLSMASRQGHLCVTVDKDTIVPDPASIWVAKGVEASGGTDKPDFEKLCALITQGAHELGGDLLAAVDVQGNIQTSSIAPVYKHGVRYYFQRNWMLETHFVKGYLRMLKQLSPKIVVDIDIVEKQVAALRESGRLLEEQAKAILHGCRSCLTVVTGGPGTGKTYTAGLLLRTLWDNIGKTERSHCKIVVTAPTGKAAAHLEGSILRAFEGVAERPAIKAQTLHALLVVKGSRQVERNVSVDGDFIIVDESSMIDVWIMGDLLASVKPGARVILLGDTSQLPSVEGGSLFADIVQFHKQHDKEADTITHLKVCQRAELRNIVDVAAHIDGGDVEGVLGKISWDGEGSGLVGVDFAKWGTPLQIQHALVHSVAEKYPMIVNEGMDPLEMIRRFSAFRLLTPMREGCLGVDELNRKIYSECLKKAPWGSHFVVPMMITKNDYRLNVFNGDMGVLVQAAGGSQEKSFVYLIDREDGIGFRKVSLASLPAYEYAYCLSVHKSQGSEFDRVALVVPQGSEVFGREALYTAVTRAKKSLELWADKDTLQLMIAKQTTRYSGVSERLMSGI